MLSEWSSDKDNFFINYLNRNDVSGIIEIVKNSVFEKQKLLKVMHNLDNFILHGKVVLTAKIKQCEMNKNRGHTNKINDMNNKTPDNTRRNLHRKKEYKHFSQTTQPLEDHRGPKVYQSSNFRDSLDSISQENMNLRKRTNENIDFSLNNETSLRNSTCSNLGLKLLMDKVTIQDWVLKPESTQNSQFIISKSNSRNPTITDLNKKGRPMSKILENSNNLNIRSLNKKSISYNATQNNTRGQTTTNPSNNRTRITSLNDSRSISPGKFTNRGKTYKEIEFSEFGIDGTQRERIFKPENRSNEYQSNMSQIVKNKKLTDSYYYYLNSRGLKSSKAHVINL